MMLAQGESGEYPVASRGFEVRHQCGLALVPQGLKPASFGGLIGTAEAVPFPNPCPFLGPSCRDPSRQDLSRKDRVASKPESFQEFVIPKSRLSEMWRHKRRAVLSSLDGVVRGGAVRWRDG